MADTSPKAASIPLKTVSPVPVEMLVMDQRNPRLLAVANNLTDEKIIAHLYRAEDLGELLQSVAANGYLDIEPLIVLEQGGRLVVLEGNRRLAAIRLFRDTNLVHQLRIREQTRITLPDISEVHLETLDRVSVYRVASRSDARPFIGFKHINGAAKWNSYAKAKFAADWYRSDQVSLSDIAESIGDKHDTVKRMVNAIYVLEQAQSAKLFELEDRVNPRFNFSHLYTALSRIQYMQFLGLDATWSSYDPTPNPVSDDKAPLLSEVLVWIYGSRTQNHDPVVQSQNPDIKRLGDVLANAEGLAVLRASRSLSDAHASTQPADRKFSEALVRTRSEIRMAANSLRGFDGCDSSLLGIAEDICETAQTLYDRMKTKVREATLGKD